MQNRRRDFGSTSLLFPYSFGLLLALAVTIFSPMACWFLTTVARCVNNLTLAIPSIVAGAVAHFTAKLLSPMGG